MKTHLHLDAYVKLKQYSVFVSWLTILIWLILPDLEVDWPHDPMTQYLVTCKCLSTALLSPRWDSAQSQTKYNNSVQQL